MKKLSREQAIAEYRKMWKWIAEETEKREEKVYKFEYFEHKGMAEESIPAHKCYLCEYMMQIKGRCRCLTDCPIDWCGSRNCTCFPSPYVLWDVSAYWEDCYRYAKQISELPEKGEIEE